MALGRRWSTRLLLLAVAALLVACAGRNAGPDETPAPSGAQQEGNGHRVPIAQPVALPTPAPALPAPSGLTSRAPKHTQFVEADLSKIASQFDLALPNNLVVADGGDVDFTPNFTGRLGGCAYCIYDFNISGYDRNAQLCAVWATAADDGNIFFGLANWDRDRWDWFKGSAQPKLNLPTITPYISFSGELLLVVLCCGDAQRLSSVRIGGQPPTAIFSISPNAAMVPAFPVADASASSDPDGSIVKYEIDADGDGSFDDSSTDQPFLHPTYDQAGFYSPVLRVTDDDGLSATFTQNFTAGAEWAHSVGRSGQDGFSSICYDGKGALYAAGFSLGSGAADVLLSRFDLAGNLIWARTWDGGRGDSCEDMLLLPDGKLLLCSLAEVDLGAGPRQSLLLQTWSPDGELLLSRYCNDTDQLFPDTMALLGTSVYVCGRSGAFNTFCLLKYDPLSGTIQHLNAFTFTGADSITINDIALTSAFVIGQGLRANATAVGAVSLPAGQRAFAASFDNSADEQQLDVSGAVILDLPSSAAGAVLKRGTLIVDTVVSGSYLNGSTTDFFLSNLASGSDPQCRWSTGLSGSVAGLTISREGRYMLSATRGFEQGVFLDFGSDGSVFASDLISDGQGLVLTSNLQSILGVCGIFGGDCMEVSAFESNSILNSSGPTTFSWTPISMSAANPSVSTLIDLPGTVEAPTLQIDTADINSEALLISRPF